MGKPVHVSCWARISASGTEMLKMKVAKVAAGTKEGRWAGAPEWKDHLFGTLDQLRQKDERGGSKLVVGAHLGHVASTGSGA